MPTWSGSQADEDQRNLFSSCASADRLLRPQCWGPGGGGWWQVQEKLTVPKRHKCRPDLMCLPTTTPRRAPPCRAVGRCPARSICEHSRLTDPPTSLTLYTRTVTPAAASASAALWAAWMAASCSRCLLFFLLVTRWSIWTACRDSLNRFLLVFDFWTHNTGRHMKVIRCDLGWGTALGAGMPEFCTVSWAMCTTASSS